MKLVNFAGVARRLEHGRVFLPLEVRLDGEELVERHEVGHQAGDEFRAVVLDARTEDLGIAVGLPLHEPVRIDVLEEQVGLVEQAVEAAVMIEVRVRQDGRLEVEPGAEAAEAPSQEAEHVVARSGIDHEQLVVRRNHQTAVALPDVDEHELEEALALQIGRAHEAIAAAGMHRNEGPLVCCR